jgi:tol-pal system protein YbgF
VRAILSLGTAGVLALTFWGCTGGSELQSIQTQLSEIQRQVLQLQRQMAGKEAVENLAQRIEAQQEALLRAEAEREVAIGGLTAQIEQLQARLDDSTYRLSQLSQQVAATHQELQAVRAQQQDAADAASRVRAASPVPEDPEALYRAAYNDYLRGNYDRALESFQIFLESFPDNELSDNAVYWYGECYYRQGEYRRAIQRFEELVTRFPRSDKIPSALLKKGFAHLELGERPQGVVQLQHVTRQYPGSDEANLARQRLRELGVDEG